jgi:hypothetical protein
MKSRKPAQKKQGISTKHIIGISSVVIAIIIVVAVILSVATSANEVQTLPTLVLIYTDTNEVTEVSIPESPTAEATEAFTQMLIADNSTSFSSNTAIPTEMENIEELSLQEEVHSEILALDAVDAIISLDIDLSEDQAPLVYIDLVLNSGYSNVQTADLIKQELNTLLDTTDYSDFVLIASDGLMVMEYKYNAETNTWYENQLVYTTPATQQSP